MLASCSVDKTVRLWDLRTGKQQIKFQAHETDVNVISWNHHTRYLLASGDDSGEFAVWDLRNVAKEKENSKPISRIRWH